MVRAGSWLGLAGLVGACALCPGSARAMPALDVVAAPGATQSHVTAVSADGAVVAGLGTVGGQRAFEWREGVSTLVPLVVLPPPAGGWLTHDHADAWISDVGGTLVVEQRSWFADSVTGNDRDVLGIAWRDGVATHFATLAWRDFVSSILTADIVGIAADGSLAYGDTGSAFQGIPQDEMHRWDTVTSAHGQPALACPPGYEDPAMTQAIIAGVVAASADGSVVAGHHSCLEPSLLDDLIRPFRWDAGSVVYPFAWQWNGEGVPEALSADGSTMVGTTTTIWGEESFVWFAGQAATRVANLSGMAGVLPRISHLSSDGSVLIGTTQTIYGRVAFRWQGGQLVWLGDLPGGAYESHVTAATPDASVIAGIGDTPSGPAPFYWTADGGLRSLDDVLAVENGIDLTDWALDEVVDLSDDGLVLVGNGTHQGVEVGFRAVIGAAALPGPAATPVGVTALAVGCLLVALACSRRVGVSGPVRALAGRRA